MYMAKIAFLTDSTAYLNRKQIEQYQVTVVPLSVMFGAEAFFEGVDLTNEQFYRRLATEKIFPTTSQPSVGLFVDAFEKLLAHHDAVMCLFLSAKLSGTYQSAKTAADMVSPEKIWIVDSRISSYGIAGPMMDAIELARQDVSVEEILSLWQKELDTMHAFFLVDGLEALHRGGRIGGAAAVFGSLLQIKPILTIRDGRIDLFEKVRTHRKAMDRMLAEFDAYASTGVPIQLGVVHTLREGDARELLNHILQKYPNVRGELAELGPVVGVHVGEGLLALVYYQRFINRDSVL